MRKLDPSIRRRVLAKVEEAAPDPFRFAKQLAGSPYWRLRVGDWQVILEIDQGAIRILILEVKHRKTAYR